ncbi:MAG: hypothetical protein DLM71_09585 [Chloroflexi bacterium]|nr:MAG: hypothetical protein DLM71_09585 [Chloroflexota bacterium]
MYTPGPRIDRLWPEPALGLELEVALGSLRLPPPGGPRPVVGLNMVTSLDGRAQIRGTTSGLSSRTDRRLMRWLRAPYDAVASGAGTLRDSGLWPGVPPDLADLRVRRGQSSQPTEVLVAGTRPVPVDATWFGHPAPRIVIVGATSPLAEPDAPPLPEGTELLVAPTDRPAPGWILAALAARGIGSVLLEGGPTLNASFLAADALDEVYLTITGKLLGTDALRMISPVSGGSPFAEQPRAGRLVSVHRAGDELYLRYRFTPADPPDEAWP